MFSRIILGLIALCLVAGSPCRRPPPAEGYTNQKYSGEWFEVAKAQTFGGAFFERNCVCTELTFTETNPANGDGKVVNACREKAPTGKWTNVTGDLFNSASPGTWQEKIEGTPTGAANYTIISLGEDYAVEYDCTSSLGITNYCIHVLSRTRTMETGLLNKLIAQAEAQDLTPEKLPYKMTMQEGC